jgi:hypothetical protein
MIHYHGGRHSTQQIAVEIWRRRHALVSFADAGQLPIASEVSQSFAVDNGAFSVWKQGVAVDWEKYYGWVEEWMRHPGFDWAVIPDMIDGTEAQNDEFIATWPLPHHAGVPVWHLHESIERLRRLCGSWQRVALGSSGKYSVPGTARWWQRMAQAMEAVCENGRPINRLHGLRMLRPSLYAHLPLASTDSAGVSRGVGTTNWGGAYRSASGLVKALVLIDSYESQQSAAVWAGIPEQWDLFAC